jgi:hypothetical protein
MSTMSAKSRTALFMLGISGTLLAWAGGFMLSSSNSRCIDGPNIHECSGTFASDAWHRVGLISVIAGIVIVIAAIAVAALSKRSSPRLNQP